MKTLCGLLLGSTIVGLMVAAFIHLLVKVTKGDDNATSIKNTRGENLKELTKREALILVSDCPRGTQDLVKKGTKFFMTNNSSKDCLNIIPDQSLLLVKEFVLRDLVAPELPRVLIMDNGSKMKVRIIWSINSGTDDEDHILLNIYNQEMFKQFVESGGDENIKGLWELSKDFKDQYEKYKNTPYIFTTTERDKTGKITFKLDNNLYFNIYQVVAKITV